MNVIVIGAGVVGVSIADALATAGASVTVLEMRAPGRGASQASAGMLAPYTEGHGSGELLALASRSLDLFDDLIARLRHDTGRTIEYARTGTLEIAFSDADRDRLVAAKRALDDRGIAADLLDRTDLGQCEPAVSSAAVAGLLTRSHGFVGVDSLMAGFVHRARFSGATFVGPAEAVSIEERGDAVEIRYGDRYESADYVVVAAGSWSGRVRVKHFPVLPVKPVRGQLLHLDWTASPRPSRIVWGPDCYTVPWSSGALLVGATVEDAGFDEQPTAEGVSALTTAVINLLPGSAAARFRDVRVGLRPALPDGLPAIGPLGPASRVVIATGHYRNGVLLAPITAEIVSNYILRGEIDPSYEAVSPGRFLARSDG